MLAQPLLMLFAPLGGRRHRELFSVPAGEEDRPPRPPSAALRSPSVRASSKSAAHPLDGIDATIDPGVTMVADDHRVVWPFAATNGAGHGPDRPDAIVGAHAQADDGVTWSSAIGESALRRANALELRARRAIRGSRAHHRTRVVR